MPIPFDGQPLDQQRFLGVLRRVLPPGVLDPIFSQQGGGQELYVAIAAMAARIATAVFNVEVGNYALHALGGAKASGFVTATRPNAIDSVTVLKGTVVGTAQGRNFVTLRDCPITGLALSADVEVEAVAEGWEYNVRGAFVDAAGETLSGLVDRFVLTRTDPAYFPGLTVTNALAMEGGRAPMLDAVAEDRGLRRGGGESDAALSLRARTLPDTVSPAAVLRLLHSLLDPDELPFDFIETFEHRYQECFDAPSPNAGTPSYQPTPPLNPLFNDRTFVLDDPRAPDIHFRNRTMDDVEYRACFVVVVRRDITLRDLGFALDDPGVTPLDFHPVAGKPWRQTPAPDLDSTMAPDVVFGCCYDGFDIKRRAIYASVWNSLQTVRAASVAAVMDYVRP